MTDNASSSTGGIRKRASIHRASLAAEKSSQNKKPQSASEFVKKTRVTIEFQILALQSQLQLLDELSALSDEDKLETLFSLLDKDGDGKIDAVELADGLRKIRGDVNFEESLALAIKRVATFDSDADAKLDISEFKVAVDTLLEGIGCNFHDLSELLVMQVLFSSTGNTMMENIAGALVTEDVNDAVKEEEEFRKAVVDERMKAIFGLFDINGDGEIDFKEVVLGMYKLTEDLDGASSAAVSALLMLDENDSRTLNFKEFTRFMTNFVAAAVDKMSFDDVANGMTRMASQTGNVSSDEIQHLFAMDQTMKALSHMEDAKEGDVAAMDTVELAKVNRLFDLFDTDQDNTIDFHELALGLRKFKEASDMNATVEETMAVMNAFDTDNNQKLDRNEFALFISEFARKSGSSVFEMVDFMIVCTALKENTKEEETYIKSISASDIYYWGY